jgi:hypothetical protein
MTIDLDASAYLLDILGTREDQAHAGGVSVILYRMFGPD